ncbi:MAG: exosortase C-terminal domain/associated protein EpsI [Candidatus Omnitrophota bacterium]
MRYNKSTIGYIIIITMLVVTSFASINLYFRQMSDHDKVDVRSFPKKLGQWQGRDLEITEREYEVLETRNIVYREYVNPSGAKVFLFIIYSETNRLAFHPPEVCLIGGGITIADKRREPVVMDKREFMANKLYLEKGDYRDIALYAYKTGDLYTDNYLLQQVHFVLNQILGKDRGGATIRVSMPVLDGEETTVATLKDFMKKTIQTLEALQKG